MNTKRTTPAPAVPSGAGFLRAWIAWAAALCFLGGGGGVPVTGASGGPFPPLTTVRGNPRLPGKFVWADLVTDDLPAARRFYAGLFGWTFREVGGYAIALKDDRPLCGVFHRPRPADQPGARPRWIGYLSVPNVARAEKAAVRHGGRVLEGHRAFPDRGEQAILADPEGALFGVVKSAAGDPEDFLAEPGEWIWIQLLSRDAVQSSAFYRTVGGYEVVANTRSNRLSDQVLVSQGFARATVRTIPAGAPDTHPHWLLFVRVRNVEESAALAGRLGGKVLVAPSKALLNGTVAVVSDPTGGAVGLLEWNDEVMKGAR